MATINPSNMSEFLKTLNKRPSILLSEVKSEINDFISFLELSYIEETDDLREKSNDIIAKGYVYQFKIRAYFETLLVKEENQSDKFKYEECRDISTGPTRFINIFCDIKHQIANFEIQQILDKSKICRNTPELLCQLEQHGAKTKEHFIKNNTIIYNNFINETIMMLNNMKFILDKI